MNDETSGEVLRVLPGRYLVFRDPRGQVQRARVLSGPTPRPRSRATFTHDGRGWVVQGWAG